MPRFLPLSTLRSGVEPKTKSAPPRYERQDKPTSTKAPTTKIGKDLFDHDLVSALRLIDARCSCSEKLVSQVPSFSMFRRVQEHEAKKATEPGYYPTQQLYFHVDTIRSISSSTAHAWGVWETEGDDRQLGGDGKEGKSGCCTVYNKPSEELGWNCIISIETGYCEAVVLILSYRLALHP